MNKKHIIGIIGGIVILIIGALLRITGYKWGLPDATHLYSFHPDEGINISAALRIFAGDKEPGFYNYSSLYFYITSYVLTFASGWGILNIKETLTQENLTTIYMCGRITSLIFSIGTIGIVFAIGYKLKGYLLALIASLLYALTPILVMHSKFIAVDGMCGFFVALTIFCAILLNNTDENNLKNKKYLTSLILCGVCAGLAMGVKYNGIIVFLVPFTVELLKLINKKSKFNNFIIATVIMGVCALITFLITTPGVFLNNAQFVKDFTYEINHMRTGHGDEFVNTGNGLIYTFNMNMRNGLGWPFAVFSIISLFTALFSRNNTLKSMAIFGLVYYISISLSEVRFARYLIPIMPVLAILTAYLFYYFIKNNKIMVKTLFTLLLLFTLSNSLLLSNNYNRLFVAKETRIEALGWLEKNVSKKEAIGLPTVPWFYSPPYSKDTSSSPMRSVRWKYAMENTRFTLKCQKEEENEWNVEYLKQEKPKYVITTSIELFHKLRVKRPETLSYMKYLKNNYEIAKTFSHAEIYDQLNKYLPSDMTYLQPTITIYKIKE